MSNLAKIAPWHRELPPITRAEALEPMGLELREQMLNERLMDRYYTRKAREAAEMIRLLQRRGVATVQPRKD